MGHGTMDNRTTEPGTMDYRTINWQRSKGEPNHDFFYPPDLSQKLTLKRCSSTSKFANLAFIFQPFTPMILYVPKTLRTYHIRYFTLTGCNTFCHT